MQNKKTKKFWGIIFSNIYYDEPFTSLDIKTFLEAILNFDLRAITAPQEVGDIIEKIFFSEYINNKICFKETFRLHKDIFFY